MGRVLFVVTSHGVLGSTGQQTGYYLSEVAHPFQVLHEAGYEIDFVSPKGGLAPMDPKSYKLEDPRNKAFWETHGRRLQETLSPEQVDPSRYVAMFYAGGHGTMWDFPENQALARLAASIYERGGAIGAVCHGPAGLLPIRLSNGRPLVAGRRINSFTNEEEQAVQLDKVVPFLLETRLKELGAIHVSVKNFTAHVEVDDRIVTGQNPASAESVGRALVEVLSRLSVLT
ncbi:type 1 glutamine amidotransferase domain-containing protein [Rhodothermus bifroesti]|uniref:Type 1 glutamine amidotransferase domain-containing protein n=1 Tax=Rhodothermus marinus TaxID=29549 RepID=A0A7V2B2A5_RHOMR|nr:type 1 glutamine amidotransferase domain-containing protein [Rhodothermus bifroesti]GBD01892.1 Molecular chaperone Hsp31 and glyoxalase 3 [bacterium HR18]